MQVDLNKGLSIKVFGDGYTFQGQFSNYLFLIILPLFFIFKPLRFYLIPLIYCIGIIGTIEILLFDKRIYQFGNLASIILCLALFFHIAILFLPFYQYKSLNLDNYNLKEFSITFILGLCGILFVMLWLIPYVHNVYNWPYFMSILTMIILFFTIYNSSLIGLLTIKNFNN